MAFIRMLRHVCLAVLWAVTTPSVIASSLFSFAPACLASLECSLAYSLAYSIVLLTLLLIVVKSLKSLLKLFFKTEYFFGVCTDLQYWYHFSILYFLTDDIYYIITWHAFTCLIPAYCTCLLLLATYLILPDIWHVITWHLPWQILDSYNYHNTGMMTWHLDYILIYSSIVHTPDTTCTHDTPDMLLLILIHW